jgi:hypothetical protein
MADDLSIAHQVHSLLLSAHPQPNDLNLARASQLAAKEQHEPVQPRDHFQADTFLAIQKVQQAMVAEAGADEGERLLVEAIRAAEHWVKAWS